MAGSTKREKSAGLKCSKIKIINAASLNLCSGSSETVDKSIRRRRSPRRLDLWTLDGLTQYESGRVERVTCVLYEQREQCSALWIPAVPSPIGTGKRRKEVAGDIDLSRGWYDAWYVRPDRPKLS